MRLFYAILLSEEVLDALTDAQERLRAETVGGRLSRRENPSSDAVVPRGDGPS